MRVAVAVWNGRIAPVFDVARQAWLLEVTAGRVVNRSTATLPGDTIWRQAAAVVAWQADVLICGAVSRPMAALLTTRALRLVPFVAGEAETVITAFLAGQLPQPALMMPGCCGRGGRRRGAQHGGYRAASRDDVQRPFRYL